MADKMVSVKMITEDFNLKGEDYAHQKELHLDFTHLQKINSIGLRGFIIFLKSIPATTQIKYHHCSPLFVHMFNIVDGLLPPHVEIKSLFIPYFCPTCQNDYTFEAHSPFNKASLHEVRQCPDDGAQLELFYSENTFFKFLKA